VAELALNGRQLALLHDNIELVVDRRISGLPESVSRGKDASLTDEADRLIESLERVIFELLSRVWMPGGNSRRQHP